MVLKPSTIRNDDVDTTRKEPFSLNSVKFSYYLLGQDFTLRTDHSSLRWLDSFHHKATDVLT